MTPVRVAAAPSDREGANVQLKDIRLIIILVHKGTQIDFVLINIVVSSVDYM
jgi:hypothetical protein